MILQLVYRNLIVDLLTPSLPLIEALQRYGWLGAPMKLFSFLGSEPFFLLLLPLIYWNINRRIGARLGVLLISSVVINDLVKVAFALPRPFWTQGVGQLASTPETSFGFPSGHAQSTAAIWTFLALQTKRPFLWVPLSFALLVCVALSRLFLGAHYPLDIVGGALIGYAILWVFGRAEKPLSRAIGHSWPLQLGALILACIIVGVLYWLASHRLVLPQQTTPGFEAYVDALAGLNFAKRIGALFGLGSGLMLAFRLVPFEVEATRAQKIARFIVGIAVLAVLRAATSKLLPSSLPFAFAGYFGMTFWVTLLAPLVFTRLKWMKIEAREPVVAAI